MIDDPIIAERPEDSGEVSAKIHLRSGRHVQRHPGEAIAIGKNFVSFPPKRHVRHAAVLPASPVQETASVGSEPSVRLVTDG